MGERDAEIRELVEALRAVEPLERRPEESGLEAWTRIADLWHSEGGSLGPGDQLTPTQIVNLRRTIGYDAWVLARFEHARALLARCDTGDSDG